jgi:hypothetical protein
MIALLLLVAASRRQVPVTTTREDRRAAAPSRLRLLLGLAGVAASTTILGLSAALLGINSHHVPQAEPVSLLIFVPSELEDPMVTISLADPEEPYYAIGLEQDAGSLTTTTSASLIRREHTGSGVREPLSISEVVDGRGRKVPPRALLDATSWKVLVDVRGRSARVHPLLVGVASPSEDAAYGLVAADPTNCARFRIHRPTPEKGVFRLFNQGFRLEPA